MLTSKSALCSPAQAQEIQGGAHMSRVKNLRITSTLLLDSTSGATCSPTYRLWYPLTAHGWFNQQCQVWIGVCHLLDPSTCSAIMTSRPCGHRVVDLFPKKSSTFASRISVCRGFQSNNWTAQRALIILMCDHQQCWHPFHKLFLIHLWFGSADKPRTAQDLLTCPTREDHDMIR